MIDENQYFSFKDIWQQMPLSIKLMLWLICGILIMVIIILILAAIGLLPAWIGLKFNLIQVSWW